MIQTKPNLFIIGAPKCASSSLFAWLAGHPEVCGSSVKETFYLVDEENPFKRDLNWHSEGVEGLESFYRHYKGERYTLEGTTHNFYQETAILYASRSPNAKAIALVRNPVEILHSTIQYAANNKNVLTRKFTPTLYFEYFISGRSVYPDLCRSPRTAYVLDDLYKFTCISKYLIEWKESMGEKNFKIVTQECLKNYPYETLSNLSAWLEFTQLHPSGCALRHINVSHGKSYPQLHALALALSKFIPRRVKQHAHLRKIYGAFQGKASATTYNIPESIRTRFSKEREQIELLVGTRMPDWIHN